MTVRTDIKLDGDQIVVRRQQDVEPILEANKLLANEPQKRAATFRHIGSIPNVLIEKWLTEEGAPVLQMNKHEFDKFIRRKLNDPQYRYLKTTGGSV